MAKALQKYELDSPVNQEQLGKLLSFEDKKAHYRKNYIAWDAIERANPPKYPTNKTKHLSKSAKELLAVIVQKLKKDRSVFLNHKYLSSITKCERRQNNRIIQQLSEILDISYHNSVTHNGKKYRYSYEFSHKQQTQENVSVAEISVESKMSRKNEVLHINNKNKNIENIDLRSNFLKNTEEKELQETKAKILHFNQYLEPKSLNEHYPLTKEDYIRLQRLSGREFTLNAMNEILLDMSRKPKLQGHTFPSKDTFIFYMAKVLWYEKRDAVKISNTNFKIITRATEAEIITYTTQAQREEFMATIEQTAIDMPTPENRFKAKLACTLPPTLGYNLLSNLCSIYLKGTTLRLVTAKIIEMTEFSKGMIFNQAQAIGSYGDIKKLEISSRVSS